jgi:hypothetical protein
MSLLFLYLFRPTCTVNFAWAPKRQKLRSNWVIKTPVGYFGKKNRIVLEKNRGIQYKYKFQAKLAVLFNGISDAEVVKFNKKIFAKR